MAKYFGKIGFADQNMVSPGIYEDVITEYEYYGDLTRNTRRLQTGDKVNDDIEISNQISIVAGPYALKNFHSIRYST